MCLYVEAIGVDGIIEISTATTQSVGVGISRDRGEPELSSLKPRDSVQGSRFEPRFATIYHDAEARQGQRQMRRGEGGEREEGET